MELGPVWGGTKPAEEKKKASLKLQCWIQGGGCNADIFRYGDISEFKSQVCATPCKGGRNSGLEREEREEKVEHGNQSSMSFTSYPWGWDGNSYGLVQ